VPEVLNIMKGKKENTSLYLTKYDAMKTYSVLNYAPHREDVLKKGRYSYTHS